MHRHQFLRLVALASLATAMLSTGKAVEPEKGAAAKAVKPNIIFILADDLGQEDLGCYGQKLIKTPRLDRMAAEGTRYTQAYCGTTVCAPSRASLMTGLHCGHCPIRANRPVPLPAETLTVAEVLKSAGYATACMGKWGMGMLNTTGSPLKKGFDHFFGYVNQGHAHCYFPTYLYNDDQRLPLEGNDGKGVGKTYAQNLIQNDVLAWVKSQKDRPFFLFYAVTLPHSWLQIDRLGEYEDREGWTIAQKTKAAMVTRLDTDVGQLLDLLKELDVERNTLVMFAGDNGIEGDNRFFYPRRELRGGKRSMNEGGLRQAAIARWPGVVPAGRVSDEPWAFWDFLPTAAELAGAGLPDGFQPDGLSLVPMLKGGPAPQRECFYWELHEGTPRQAVRFGQWKAIRSSPSAPLELYDLATDVGENKNLAAERPELVAQAEALMKRERTDDPNWPMVERRPRAKQPPAAGKSGDK